MIEPLLSKQWFVKVGPLRKRRSSGAGGPKTRIYPSNWEGVYYDWMNNIKDWCISRQIWWGHRIPAWYCRGCGEVMCGEGRPKTCVRTVREQGPVSGNGCAGHLVQFRPVAFSTLGWPDLTDELKTFYPTRSWSPALTSSSSGWPE
jgi:valyl-tRNA synthetase